MEIIGHRGARGLAPENTLAALRAGIKAGADWLEFDVRATEDGKVILIHDKTTLRITLKRKVVAKTKWSSLRQLKTRGGEPIATINQAFKTIGTQVKINVEIKSKGCAHKVVENIERLVKSGANYERFLVSSFSIGRLREIHRLNNKIPLGLLHNVSPYKFLRLRGLRVQVVGLHHRTLTANIIHQAKIRELKIYAYTVNNPKRAKQLQEMGVDGIFTDRPDKMVGLQQEAE